MTWVAWRQVRLPAVAAAAALTAVVLILAVTGPRLAHDFKVDGLAACAAGQESTTGSTCGDLTQAFLGKLSVVTVLGGVLVLLPGVVGMFWGAPLLAREYENGTHRLAWTQSVTRTRWLATKLAVVGMISLAATTVFSLAFTWWSEPRDRLSSRIGPGLFTQRGIAPIAYVAFALALGVVIGTLVRRMLPAMVLTLIVVQLVIFGVGQWVRPHLLEPVELRYPTFTFYGDEPPARMDAEHGWVLSSRTLDRDDQVISPAGTISDARAAEVCDIPIEQLYGERGKELLDECGQWRGLVDVTRVHPADRFWSLQAAESALYASAAGGLVAFAFWRVRRGSG
jgi:hypothetical protein